MESNQDKIVVIGEEALTLGFRLAGVTESYDLSGAEGAQKLLDLLKRPDVGIIVASSSLRKSMDWRIENAVESSSKPIVVFVPSRGAGQEAGETSLKELIRRSIGINLEG